LSSNGLSSDLGFSKEASAGGASSTGAGSDGAAGSGVGPAIFNLYFFSSIRLFFLTLQ
jgi:hypothetical protein